MRLKCMDNQKKGFMHRLDYAIERLEKWFVVLSAILLFSMMFIISINTILRFLFNINLVWSIEVSEYIMLYVTFLTAPWLLRKNEHINVEILYDAVSAKTRTIFNIICNVFGSVVSLLLTVFGFTVTLDSYMRDVTLYNFILMPKFILLLIIPVSGLFMFLEFSRRWLKVIPRSPSPKEMN